MVLRAFSCLSGVATQSLPKHVPHSSSWFSRSDTAFPLLSCHSSACRNKGVLARESFLAAMILCALVFRWYPALSVAFSSLMPHHYHALVVPVCRAPDPARNVCGHVPV